ncbi:MAG: hypothetical protein AVDCRST_MAG27-3465, partial [uncultured Craurococcus sp.]
ARHLGSWGMEGDPAPKKPAGPVWWTGPAAVGRIGRRPAGAIRPL